MSLLYVVDPGLCIRFMLRSIRCISDGKVATVTTFGVQLLDYPIRNVDWKSTFSFKFLQIRMIQLCLCWPHDIQNRRLHHVKSHGHDVDGEDNHYIIQRRYPIRTHKSGQGLVSIWVAVHSCTLFRMPLPTADTPKFSTLGAFVIW